MDAIKKEMKNVMVAFEEIDGNPHELQGFQQITGHLVFDLKLSEGFRRKARYCADGHKTNHHHPLHIVQWYHATRYV